MPGTSSAGLFALFDAFDDRARRTVTTIGDLPDATRRGLGVTSGSSPILNEIREAHDRSMTTNDASGAASIGAPDRFTAPDPTGYRSLSRPVDGRMLGGVASAIADYLAVDVAIIRIAIVVLCLVGGAGLPLYAAGWLLIPDRGSEWSIATQLLHGLESY
jgi:phage shock protein PspC (stress-responsive transcriptional regulator)